MALAIDGSGDIWVANHTPVTVNSQPQTVTEFIGLAATTVTPLALAVKNGEIGLPPGRPGITPSSIPTGTVGLPYSVTFNGAGGSGTYTWTVTAGLASLNGIGLTFSSGSNAGALLRHAHLCKRRQLSLHRQADRHDNRKNADRVVLASSAALVDRLHSRRQRERRSATAFSAFMLSGFNPGGHFFDEIGDFFANGTGGITSGNADVDGDQNISAFRQRRASVPVHRHVLDREHRQSRHHKLEQCKRYRHRWPSSNRQLFAANSVVGGVAQSGKIIEADGSGFVLTGTFAIQNTSAFTAAALGNGYAVGMQGVDGPNPNRRALASHSR